MNDTKQWCLLATLDCTKPLLNYVFPCFWILQVPHLHNISLSCKPLEETGKTITGKTDAGVKMRHLLWHWTLAKPAAAILDSYPGLFRVLRKPRSFKEKCWLHKFFSTKSLKQPLSKRKLGRFVLCQSSHLAALDSCPASPESSCSQKMLSKVPICAATSWAKGCICCCCIWTGTEPPNIQRRDMKRSKILHSSKCRFLNEFRCLFYRIRRIRTKDKAIALIQMDGTGTLEPCCML